MKYILFWFFTVPVYMVNSNAQKLEKLWETDTLFKVPESVLPDAAGKRLFISNIDGASGGKDGKGHISVMETNGKIKKFLDED